MWEQHGRMEEYITEVSCKDEIQSMQEHGQIVPAIGRRLPSGSTHDVEIICGARRLFAARHLNIEIAVEMRELNDREGIVLFDIENRQRRDWSAYERGRSFAGWLSAGHFESQEVLARSLRISASQVSRLLKIAKLPAVVVAAFAEPAQICEMWGIELYDACENPKSRSRIIERARVLTARTTVLSAREIFDQLRLDGRSRGPRQNHRQEIVLGRYGQALFRIKHQDASVSVTIAKQHMPPAALDRIKEAIAEILQDASPQVTRNNRDFSLAAREHRSYQKVDKSNTVALGLLTLYAGPSGAAAFGPWGVTGGEGSYVTTTGEGGFYNFNGNAQGGILDAGYNFGFQTGTSCDFKDNSKYVTLDVVFFSLSFVHNSTSWGLNFGAGLGLGLAWGQSNTQIHSN